MSEHSAPASNPSNWGNRSGIAAATKYNPHLWSPEELRAIFIVRQRELATILQALRTADATTAPQHMLITGQRGMGKSTLLQRVALAVEDDAELTQKWLPLRFPEEQYTVSTPAELWANVIGALADALERQSLPTLEIDTQLALLEQLPTAQREEASLAWLAAWCAAHHSRLLLLIDSTDLLMANLASGDANKRGTKQDGGASALWRVRKALLHSPHVLWLGGSYQPLETHALYSDAFLDFFQLIELRPLSLAEMESAILTMARVFGAGRGLRGDDAEAEVKRMFQARPERLRAMRQLTGGNPRTTVMLYELFAAGGRDSVRADLERLLDAMTPLYKARLEVLAEQPRKVLAHVMEHWAPITAKALARAAVLPVSTVSAQLTRLEQEGLVEKTKLGGTKRFGFQANERFFNIWYLMRNAPRGARARVGWLVEFMRLWYSSNELQGLARARRSEHRNARYCDEPELEYSRAMARAMPDAEDRRQLEWSVFQQARKGPAFRLLFDLQGDDAGYSTHHNYLERLEALKATSQSPHLTGEDQISLARRVISAVDLTLSKKEALIADLSTASEAKLADIRFALSETKERLVATHDLESVELVENAVFDGEFFPECPDSTLALTQMEASFAAIPSAFSVALDCLVGNHTDDHVEAACRRAIELSPDSARPLSCLGRLLSRKENQLNQAEVAFRKAIEFDPKWAVPWVDLGDLLTQTERNYEAEGAYRKAIALDSNWATPWDNLGDLLRHTDRGEEAEAAYRKAIDLDSKWAWPLVNLGNLLSQTGRNDEAEAAFRKAIELNPKATWLWVRFGNLMRQTNRNEEAEAAYRKAIDLDPEWTAPWEELGHLLSQTGLNEAAEAAFRKAIELDPTDASSWDNLGDLLSQINRNDEAEVTYQKAIELDPTWPWVRVSFGNFLQDTLKRYKEAESVYRTGIALNEGHAYLLVNLARLLAKLARRDEATALYRQVIKLAEDGNSNFLLQAHSWLGNTDLALQALDALAESASKADSTAFHHLKEQCFECHAIGISQVLINLMERSRFKDFLQPFAVALRAALGEQEALLGVAVEVRAIAQEVLSSINLGADKSVR